MLGEGGLEEARREEIEKRGRKKGWKRVIVTDSEAVWFASESVNE